MIEMSLEEIKSVQLNILDEVASFCEENQITYFLSGGTLLGAIRHKGYIPWDDDIDVMMPRPCYNRFLQLFNNRKSNIKVMAYEIDKSYHHTFAKVSDTNTYLKEGTFITYPLGVNIDIFPIDGLPYDLKESYKHIKKLGFYKNLYILKTVTPRKGRAVSKEIFLTISRAALAFINITQLIKRITRYSQKYEFYESQYVGCVVWGYGNKERIHKKNLEGTFDVQFEGRVFKAPIGYDDYLKNLYGDYMQLPPESERVTHHSYRAYWKNKMATN